MDSLDLTFKSAVLIVGGSVVLGGADVYRRHERALLENLGVSRPVIFAVLALQAILGELVVWHRSCLADNGGYATKSSVVESYLRGEPL